MPAWLLLLGILICFCCCGLVGLGVAVCFGSGVLGDRYCPGLKNLMGGNRQVYEIVIDDGHDALI